MQIALEKVIPGALKKAKPGTKEFRAAIKEGMETMGRTIFSHGVMNWTPADHWGFTNETGVMLKVVNSDWMGQWGIKPTIKVKQGNAIDAIRAALSENPDIGALVLAAAKTGNPGPLVSHFAGADSGSLPCPVMIVPGSLTTEALDRLS